MGTNSPSGPARFVESTLNPIAYPMMAGYWDKVDFSNGMKSTGYIMVRMIVHPGIEPHMVDAKWDGPETLQLRFRWPDFFKSVLQMLDFDVDENNRPRFSRDHQLTGSFGKFVHERMDDESQVWDTGYLSFDRPMDQDQSNIKVEVLDAKVGQKKYTILQIVAREAVAEANIRATIGARSVATNSNAGKDFPNIRNRDAIEDDMDETEEDAFESSPQKKTDRKGRVAGNAFDGLSNQISAALTDSIHNIMGKKTFIGPVQQDEEMDNENSYETDDDLDL